MNAEISKYLKKCRNEKKLSFAKVQLLTGITDSRLSRAEKEGSIKTFNFYEINSLAQTYDIPIVEMLINLQCLNKTDLQDYQAIFKNAALLDDDEKEHIQNEIDFLNRKRHTK